VIESKPADLWETRALPILQYVADHEAEGAIINIGQLAEGTGIEPRFVLVEVERLIDGGYLAGELQKLMTGGDPTPWFLTESRLSERGARAVSIWPRAEQLLQTLEERAAAEPDPGRKRALGVLVSAAREVGAPVLAEVLGAAAKRTLGLP
jgi:hypothetical protein